MNRTTFFRDIILHLAVRLGVIAGIAAILELYLYWVENYNPPYVEPGGYDDTFLGVVFKFLFALMVWVAWLAIEAPRLSGKGRKASALVNYAIVFTAVILLILAATYILL